MHVFPYSIRKGTRAAEMKYQIDGAEKERRSKILIELSNKNQKEYNELYVGKEVEVLIEENGKGHTKNYILVKDISEKQAKENEIIKLKITNAQNDYIEGIPL